MPSLADLAEVIGFFSYSCEDDQAFEATLSALRGGIQGELSAQLGRSKTNFRLWQDQEAIAPGKLWEAEIAAAVEESVFSFRSSRRDRSAAIIANSNLRGFSDRKSVV